MEWFGTVRPVRFRRRGTGQAYYLLDQRSQPINKSRRFMKLTKTRKGQISRLPN